MKKRSIQLFTAFILIVTIGITISSCSKKKTDTPTGTFYFHLHSNIDTNEISGNSTLYTDANGRHIAISVAQVLLSNVVLKNANGTSYTVPNAFILTNTENEEYLVGTAPAGTYTGLSFSVGLDAATNATAPSSHAASSALADADMWFGNTTSGYMFAKIEGTADTTAAYTGTNLQHFSYHVGGSANLKTVTMPTRGTGTYASHAPWVLASGGTQYIHMLCDFGKILSGLDFKTQNGTDTYTLNPGVSNAIASNFANAFLYEE
jgi:hypothetical protein